MSSPTFTHVPRRASLTVLVFMGWKVYLPSFVRGKGMRVRTRRTSKALLCLNDFYVYAILARAICEPFGRTNLGRAPLVQLLAEQVAVIHGLSLTSLRCLRLIRSHRADFSAYFGWHLGPNLNTSPSRVAPFRSSNRYSTTSAHGFSFWQSSAGGPPHGTNFSLKLRLYRK